MNVRQAFALQGAACEKLGSPFMARLMPLIGSRLVRGQPVADRILNWQGDTSAAGQSVALRLAGALHALKLRGFALSEVYPPNRVTDDALWNEVEHAIMAHQPHVMSWLDKPPQTNEVRRAAALAAALSVVTARYDLPIELLELGCSAGLNLLVDQFHVAAGPTRFGPSDATVQVAPTWTGTSPPPISEEVIGRSGVDLDPIDPADELGQLRLLAYLWPDQPERIALTRAAIGIAGRISTDVSAGDAGEWSERALATPALDRVRVMYHTIAWQYFPENTQKRALQAMENAGSPLVRFSMEADGGEGARLTLTHFPSGEVQHLGRADFHGRWVHWLA